MAYRLTRRARQEITEVYVSGVGKFGEAQADAYQSGLERTFDFLADYPRAARERREITPPVRAYPYKAHLIVYIVKDDNIVILGVKNAREDWMHQFGD